MFLSLSILFFFTLVFFVTLRLYVPDLNKLDQCVLICQRTFTYFKGALCGFED